MSNGLIIIGFLASAALISVGYYMVIPAYFNVKEFFMENDAVAGHAEALSFGELLYLVAGVFPLLFLGAIFLNAYQNSTRQRSADQFG